MLRPIDAIFHVSADTQARLSSSPSVQSKNPDSPSSALTPCDTSCHEAKYSAVYNRVTANTPVPRGSGTSFYPLASHHPSHQHAPQPSGGLAPPQSAWLAPCGCVVSSTDSRCTYPGPDYGCDLTLRPRVLNFKLKVQLWHPLPARFLAH